MKIKKVLYREACETISERRLYHFKGELNDEQISEVKKLPGIEHAFYQDRYHISINKGGAYTWDFVEWQLKRIFAGILDLDQTVEDETVEDEPVEDEPKPPENKCIKVQTSTFKCSADSYSEQSECKYFCQEAVILNLYRLYLEDDESDEFENLECCYGNPGLKCHNEHAISHCMSFSFDCL